MIADPENSAIVINGQKVQMIGASNPEDIDYTAHGISNALVIDNTGAFTNREALSRHLKSRGIKSLIDSTG